MSAEKEIQVQVPASSANLGAGFDAFALALGIHLRCRLRKTGRGPKITVSGTGADDIPRDETNLIWRTFSRFSKEQAVELDIANEIPLARGLGSSAAAIVAGLALADACLESNCDKNALIERASNIEGHPDNVAAASLGGMVVSCQSEDGRILTARCSFPPQIRVVVVVPQFALSTEAARDALPQQYSRRDAVFNVQRSALFVAALHSGRTELLKEAMRDRLHQPYRRALVPGFDDALKLDGVPGLLGLALSGAGPSIVAFCDEPAAQAVGTVVADCFRRKGIPAESRILPVDPDGLLITTN
jgi:homoserine kinase